MRATTPPRRPPAGFTLVELLVVISIIGILMGLLLGAVQKVRDVGRRTSTVSEINQLDMAVTKFKLDFGFNPPHYIRLPGVVPLPAWENSVTPAQKECFNGFKILLQMFPRWQITVGAVTKPATDWFNDVSNAGATPTGVKFCSTLTVPSGVKPSETGLVLEGSQCLVFFLGGPELRGFTPAGPYNPAAGATSIKGPYFEFATNRMNPDLTTRVNTTLLAPKPDVVNGYLNTYLDPYGTPYAYFSTFTATGYELTTYGYVPPLPGPVTTLNPAYVNPMRAYFESANKPINAGRCQIISAGKNKRFGSGTVVVTGPPVSYTYWSAGAAGYSMDSGPPGGDGGDDLTNFNGGAQLGAIGS